MLRKTIFIDQQEISYLESGEAPQTLIFIHGMGCNALTWNHQIQELSKVCRCIAIDLPAHGFSPKLQFNIGVYNYAELLFKFTQSLGLKEFQLIAHSMGGQIALMFALRYASMVDKMYLIAPAGLEQFKSFEKNLILKSMDLLNIKPILQNLKRLSAWLSPQEPSIQELLNYIQNGSREDVIQDYLATIALGTSAMLNEPVIDFLQNINSDIRIAYGLKDKMIPNPIFLHKNSSDFLKNVKSLLPSAQIFEIQELGHFPQIEDFNVINADIKEYFAL